MFKALLEQTLECLVNERQIGVTHDPGVARYYFQRLHDSVLISDNDTCPVRTGNQTRGHDEEYVESMTSGVSFG